MRRSGLYRWGVAVARHRRAVLCAYVALILVCAAANPVLQRALGPASYQINNSDSLRVERLLESSFPGLGSESDALVFNSTTQTAGQPAYRSVIEAVDRTLRRESGVRNVVGPYDPQAFGQITDGEHTAVSAIGLGGSVQQRYDHTRAIQEAVTRAAGDHGVHVWLTGASPIARDTNEVKQVDTKHAEAIGVPLALLILLFAMGALVAAVVPLVFAVCGLLLAEGVLALLTLFFHFDSLLLGIVTLIGLGIGIDYALFIVSRFREELARPRPEGRSESDHVCDAVGVALATSGRTILFSGVIVALSLCSLFVVNSWFLQEIAVGAVVVVTCMLASGMTLLPAVLALAGRRINRGALPARLQPADARPGGPGEGGGGWARWARLVMSHPILALGVSIAVLLVAAAPIFHIHYGVNVDVLKNTSTNSGKGESVLARSFTPGAVAPVEVVVSDRGPGHAKAVNAAAKRLSEELEGDTRVTGLGERRSNAGVLLIVVPSVPIDSTAATALVERIREKLAPQIEAQGGPTVLVGGPTAEILDLSNELSAKAPLILLLILGPSLLFLLFVFRSVVLPIKAVLVNLLATAATLGLAVLVFQYGHGERLLGFTSTGFIQVGVPQVMFALLFGLSMDYEIFLIRRIREEWLKTGDNELAVATGIEHTARPITAAAAIMVVIFGSFMIADMLELKQLGFALAVAIALDATLVRLVLVPAAMRLFGRWNWWLPTRLARVLPSTGED